MTLSAYEKTLKIKLPEWEQEKQEYRKRLVDSMEQIVARFIETLDKNEPIEDLVASQITTKNLYHQVCYHLCVERILTYSEKKKVVKC